MRFFLTLAKIRMQYALRSTHTHTHNILYAITQLLNTQYAFKTRKQ